MELETKIGFRAVSEIVFFTSVGKYGDDTDKLGFPQGSDEGIIVIGSDEDVVEKMLFPADIGMDIIFERLFPWVIWNSIEIGNGVIPYIKGIQGR